MNNVDDFLKDVKETCAEVYTDNPNADKDTLRQMISNENAMGSDVIYTDEAWETLKAIQGTDFWNEFTQSDYWYSLNELNEFGRDTAVFGNIQAGRVFADNPGLVVAYARDFAADLLIG